jgi:hypothetical protein
MKAPHSGTGRGLAAALLAAVWWLATAGVVGAQVGALVSPGPLSKPHVKLEGIANCQQCHDPGRGVSAQKCLKCHAPVAARIAAKKGVHRDVTTSCEGCHAEHAGVDAELRPLDTKRFDHGKETGFALDGLHAPLANACARCHKTRSFLQARPDCASCHDDVHKGTLGPTCSSCHTTAVRLADARQQFDHTKAKFQLAGAHRTVECAKCHVNRAFTGLKFASCTDCHREPHRPALGPDCTSCHSTDTWRTTKVDHSRTAFPLTGAHLKTACAACHVKPAAQVRPASARCSSCHSDVHRGGFRQDCATCHTTASFKQAPFDHEKSARFALAGRHAGLACAKCHKGATAAGPSRSTTRAASVVSVVFTGLSSSCTSCHDDVHKGAAGPSCQTCHGASSFRSLLPYTHEPALAPFFAGRHASTECRACHTRTSPPPPIPAGGGPSPGAPPLVQWTFKGTATACARCHADPHASKLGTACERCHATDEKDFAANRFSHATTTFPLTGRHESVACRQCHTSPSGGVAAPASPQRHDRDEQGRVIDFAGLGTSCASCHKDVHLGQLGAKCDTCHSTQTFTLTKFTHTRVPAAFFAGRHITATCRACHKSETATFPAGHGTAVRFVGSGSACATCHAQQDAHRGALGQECEHCHTPERWPSVNRAFHKAGLFPLEGRHLTVACASCHVNGETRGTPTRCYDCHWIRRQDDPKQTRLGTDCESCHRPTSWTAVNWNHGARTGTPLSGAHRSLACDSCHKERRFMGGSVACSTCHMKDYQRAAQPNHTAAGFPTNCEVCHQPAHTSWNQATFSHAAFPLVGVHATQACASCHRNSIYKGTPRDCVGCHAPDYQKTTNPNHAAAGFPTACESCHRATAPTWTGTSFNHGAIFPLIGTHATQACSACHKNSVYKGTSRDCIGCHAADYQRTANPNHASAGFPTACAQCHQPSSPTWSTGSFNHATVFPLVGTHATQACTACHKNGAYKGTPRDCMGCHAATYQKTANPNHAAAGFSTACETCHQPSAPTWGTGGFNHASIFPLVGLHATQACTACHKNGVYKGTPRDCMGCHAANYQRTTNPNHVSAGFSTACETCHQPSASSWSNGGFNHASVYPLVGVHATQACTTCHTNGVYKGTPRDCMGCHAAVYQRTTNPNHAAAGFPTTCDSCHQQSASSWSGATFNHASVFPLVGTHATQPCAACHVNGVYRGTPRDCAGCHTADYQRTTNPNHAAAGFPTTCEQCHQASSSTWTSSFNHNQYYPLLGRHLQQACSACHKNNVYRGTPTACVACHQTNYNQTTNPNHAAAGFPTTCESCHKAGDTSWNQGVFVHSWFPITSGRHSGIACQTCHTTTNVYTVFSCLTGCHARATTDSHHNGRSGYRYDSAACYACHPNGRADSPQPRP